MTRHKYSLEQFVDDPAYLAVLLFLRDHGPATLAKVRAALTRYPPSSRWSKARLLLTETEMRERLDIGRSKLHQMLTILVGSGLVNRAKATGEYVYSYNRDAAWDRLSRDLHISLIREMANSEDRGVIVPAIGAGRIVVHGIPKKLLKPSAPGEFQFLGRRSFSLSRDPLIEKRVTRVLQHLDAGGHADVGDLVDAIADAIYGDVPEYRELKRRGEKGPDFRELEKWLPAEIRDLDHKTQSLPEIRKKLDAYYRAHPNEPAIFPAIEAYYRAHPDEMREQAEVVEKLKKYCFGITLVFPASLVFSQ